MADEPHNFEFEVDGPDVHPNNVDALSFLAYSTAYLESLRSVARLSDNELTFVGVEIVDKCVALRVRTNNVDVAWSSASQLDNFVAGTAEPPRRFGLKAHTQKLIEARERFASSLPAASRGSLRTVLRLEERELTLRRQPDKKMTAFRYRTIDTMRVRIEKLLGSTLKARLIPVVGQPFVVTLASEELAKDVRHHWLDDVDVDVEVERDSEGNVSKGKLLRFHPLSDASGVTAWRGWVRENEVEYVSDGTDEH